MKNRERQHYDGEKDKEFIISSFKKCDTEKLVNGKRLQISGAVVLYWKIIRIDL